MVDPLAVFFQALFWRAGSVVQLQSWREALAAVLNKRGERARAYLLSSFTRSAFLSFPFFLGNAKRSRDAVVWQHHQWLLRPSDHVTLFWGIFFQGRFLQFWLDTLIPIQMNKQHIWDLLNSQIKTHILFK